MWYYSTVFLAPALLGLPKPDTQTVVSIAAVSVALLTLAFTRGADQRRLGIDNFWKVSESWDSPDNRRRRARVATELLADGTHGRYAVKDDAFDLLTTFEYLAYLVRIHAVPLQIAWAMFYDWAVGYWYVFEADIGDKRAASDDLTVYEEYERLVRRLERYDFLARARIPRGLRWTWLAAGRPDPLQDPSSFLRSETRLEGRWPLVADPAAQRAFYHRRGTGGKAPQTP